MATTAREMQSARDRIIKELVNQGQAPLAYSTEHTQAWIALAKFLGAEIPRQQAREASEAAIAKQEGHVGAEV